MPAPTARARIEPDADAVDVAIVNWNTPEAAAEAARAYLRSTGVEVTLTVVDNASEPDARRRLDELMPAAARLLANEENLGFGAGANRGLERGTGEFVCVSNADVVPRPDALARLARLAAQPGCGMVGPAFAAQSAYHAELPRPAALVARPLVGGFGHRHVDSPAPGQTLEVGQPAGACFLLRRAIWERLGGFDEDFFLWYEDVDLARRLRDLGLRNLVSGDAVVEHREGLATGELDGTRAQALRLDGLRLYTRKHHPLAARLALPFDALARALRARG